MLSPAPSRRLHCIVLNVSECTAKEQRRLRFIEATPVPRVTAAAAALSTLLFAVLSPLRQKEKKGQTVCVRERERLRVQHMEHVVGVKRSFQLSQFYKHAGWEK